MIAKELTEESIRNALKEGHAYVSHDWMCDPTGFQFTAVSGPSTIMMGDQWKFVAGIKLHAEFPVECRSRLIRNGKVASEASGSTLAYEVVEPGVYRVETWLTLDDESRGWIYSNPIYIR